MSLVFNSSYQLTRRCISDEVSHKLAGLVPTFTDVYALAIEAYPFDQHISSEKCVLALTL
ncbi:hypothetical protein V6N13_142097 [Hibiscus sabdariffa]